MNTVNKRGWVKNVAIAFLAVMLVLTFFSNHIMNRSLPEVAAQYTSSGTITARIRGTGTVEANEVFEVKYPQTRQIEQVRVRPGTEVSIGDILVLLSGSDSEELEKAKTDLHAEELKLEQMLVSTPLVGDTSASSRSVQAARNTLAASQGEQAAIPFNEELYNHTYAVYSAAKAAFDEADLTKQLAHQRLGTIDEEANPSGWARAKRDADNADRAFILAEAALAGPASDFKVQDEYRTDWIAAGTQVKLDQLALEDAAFAHSSDQRAAGVEVSLNDIDLRESRRIIDELKEEITRLENESNIEVISKVNGIVSKLNVTSGNMVDPEVPLMLIEVGDLGYSLSFSVTAEQARRVSIGEQAEVDRGWWSWGEEIRAILIGIGNDTDDPRTRRLLHFSISGDVESDDVLNLTIAQRSENYNVIVPNAAIRTDTNGDFVLVVMSSSGPLGNRFIATRADVNVIASDDVNTAVSGGLQGWDFVILTASEPITPGMQVRLVDNP